MPALVLTSPAVLVALLCCFLGAGMHGRARAAFPVILASGVVLLVGVLVAGALLNIDDRMMALGILIGYGLSVIGGGGTTSYLWPNYWRVAVLLCFAIAWGPPTAMVVMACAGREVCD